MKNTLPILAWFSTAVAVVMMLFGAIAFLAGGRFLQHGWDSYFYPAMNFLLLALVLNQFYRIYSCKNE